MVIVAPVVAFADATVGPGWVDVRGGRIHAVGRGATGEATHRFSKSMLVPGFVDIHVHGGLGAAFHSASADEVGRARRFHLSHGTTTSLASLITASPPNLLAQVRVLADCAEAGLIAGIHLEGPWLSARRPGAHDRTQLREPDREEFAQLVRASRGHLRSVTIAPELPGALDLIRAIEDSGSVPAIGHTDADYDTTRRAIAAGARVATHLFNAMRPMHHREPGPVPALLENPDVIVEVIADGAHLHDAVLHQILAVAGMQRTAVVTDAAPPAGLPDGDYQFGNLPVTVEDGIAHQPDSDVLAGSTATMADQFRRVLAQQSDRRAAVACAVQLTATTPARAAGLADVGTLAPGARADILVLDQTGRVEQVIQRGRFLSAARHEPGTAEITVCEVRPD